MTVPASQGLHFSPALAAPWAVESVSPDFSAICAHVSHFMGQSSVQNGPCTELQHFLRARTAFCVVRRQGRSAEFDELAVCLWNPRKCWTSALYVSAFLFPFSSILCL